MLRANRSRHLVCRQEMRADGMVLMLTKPAYLQQLVVEWSAETGHSESPRAVLLVPRCFERVTAEEEW